MYWHFFFSECCACDICGWSHLPSPWLGSPSDSSPTAPSLRPLIPDKVPVGPNIPPSSSIYCSVGSCTHRLSAGLPGVAPCKGIVAWAIEPHFVAFMVSCTVGQSVTRSFKLVTGQLHVLDDMTVDVVRWFNKLAALLIVGFS